MAILNLLSMEEKRVHYNIPHLPIRLESLNLPAEELSAPHWHEDLEILMAAEGSLHLQTRQREVTLQKGDACIINPRQIHAVSCHLGAQARAFCMHADLHPMIDNHTLHMTLLYPMFYDTTADGYVLSASDPAHAEMLRMLVRVRIFETDRPTAWPLELTGLLNLLLAGACRLFLPAKGNPIPSTDVEALENMVSYISQFYAEKIQLADIAAAGKVGRSKCCQIFRSYLALSPVDFLNSYRLSVSKELLINTPFKVSVIATSCGFNHQSYYTRMFREKYGCTPNEYRLQNTRESPNF